MQCSLGRNVIPRLPVASTRPGRSLNTRPAHKTRHQPLKRLGGKRSQTHVCVLNSSIFVQTRPNKARDPSLRARFFDHKGCATESRQPETNRCTMPGCRPVSDTSPSDEHSPRPGGTTYPPGAFVATTFRGAPHGRSPGWLHRLAHRRLGGPAGLSSWPGYYRIICTPGSTRPVVPTVPHAPVALEMLLVLRVLRPSYAFLLAIKFYDLFAVFGRVNDPQTFERVRRMPQYQAERVDRQKPRDGPSDSSHGAFLRAHARAVLACDFLTVDSVRLGVLYVLVFLEIGSPSGHLLQRHRPSRFGLGGAAGTQLGLGAGGAGDPDHGADPRSRLEVQLRLRRGLLSRRHQDRPNPVPHSPR